MVEGHRITKEVIVGAVVKELSALDHVLAVWEGGAAAFGRVDRWSDIDLYVLVRDGMQDEAFVAVEKGLERISGIKVKYGIPDTGWPGVFQAFYKVKGASDYLILDLAVVTPGSSEKFLDVEVHGEPVFHLLRSDDIVPTHIDPTAFADRIRVRIARLRARDKVFSVVVQKEINRGNLIEALDLYRVVVLEPLIEVLRMQHSPYHYDFKTRYIYHELPKDVNSRLEDLYIIRDLRDLQDKYRLALGWYREVLKDLDGVDFESRFSR